MLLGCIADDFTGASDLANTLTRSGMATIQFVGTPTSAAPADCDAGVVALKIRSIESADAVAQSLDALSWLRQQGCAQYMYKYCSTFDSTPDGNIGPVCEALADALGVPVTTVCPAFPTTGRTVFMGHLFVNDRLLNESLTKTSGRSAKRLPDTNLLPAARASRLVYLATSARWDCSGIPRAASIRSSDQALSCLAHARPHRWHRSLLMLPITLDFKSMPTQY
jgi:hypothetical protein